MDDHAARAETFMIEDWPSTPGVQDLRNVVADLHHGLQQRRFVGDADAIAHALARAEASGVPPKDLERMATDQFRRLFDEEARRQTTRGGLRRWIANRMQLSGGDTSAQRQLGPGRPR